MRYIPACLAAFLLVGCADYGPKEAAGGLITSGAGAYAGSLIGMGTGNLAAIGGGALLGALVGSNIGRSLDRADRLSRQPATTGTAGAVPLTAYAGTYGTVRPRGGECREYRQTVKIGDEEREAYGTACREPDGSWRIVR
jgi:surface antigen